MGNSVEDMGKPETPSFRGDVQTARAKLNKLVEDKMRELELQNLQEFADYFQIGRSTLYELLRGRSLSRGAWVRPRLDTVLALADALETPVHEIVYLIEPNARGAEMPPQSIALRRVEVRIAGWSSSITEQANGASYGEIWVEEKFAQGRKLAAFRIHGDSMAGGRHPIYHGDVVIVDLEDKGLNNTIVVAKLTNDSYLCKLLKEDRFSHIVKLASANPEHLNGTPTAIPPEDVTEIVGRVIRVIHDELSDAQDNIAVVKVDSDI